MRRTIARLLACIALIVAIPLRLNPLMVLPSSYSYTPGEFAMSQWGHRVSAFEDIMNICIGAALLLLIVSFTSLMRDDSAGRGDF